MGEVFAGRYELIDMIGEGGMGSVWQVHDRKHDRILAAKVLRQSDAGALLRFMREQGMRIHHPNVVTPLGWAGEDYGLITNRQVLEIAEAMVDAGGKAVQFDVVGSVKDGAEVFATMTLDEPSEVGGDDTPTYPFFVVTSGHDGSTACRAGFGFIRVVCANTILAQNMAWDQGTTASYTFRHTASVHDRIEEAKAAMAGLREVWAEFQVLTAELANVPTTDEQVRDFLDLFIPMPAAGAVVTDRQLKNIETERSTFMALYEDSPTTEGHRGSALGLVDTSVEYLDHYRKYRTQDTLVRRTLLSDDGLKAKTFHLAASVCGKAIEEGHLVATSN